MCKNVMIPLALLNQIVDLLKCWDISEYGYPTRDIYCHVLWALNMKKKKLKLRDAYAKIVQADNPDDRDGARIEYLRQKRVLGDYDPF